MLSLCANSEEDIKDASIYLFVIYLTIHFLSVHFLIYYNLFSFKAIIYRQNYIYYFIFKQYHSYNNNNNIIIIYNIAIIKNLSCKKGDHYM